MKPVYIVKTSWEVFVALITACKKYESSGKRSIFVLEDSNEREHHKFNLDKFDFIDELILIKLPRHRYIKAVSYHYNLYFNLNKYLKRFLNEEYEVNVFIDQGILGQFFIKRKRSVNLYEHGNGNYLVGGYPNFKTVKKLMGITPGYGRSNYVDSIFLQYPEKAPVDIQGKCKKLELSFSSLRQKYQNEICEFFCVDKIEVDSRCSVLLTQPLSEDGFYTEKQKLEIYARVINRFKNERLIIKPHPRDRSDYSSIFPSLTVLPNSFPMEILNFIDIKFEHAITICSGSVFNFDYPIKVSFLGTIDYRNLIKPLGSLTSQYIGKDEYYKIKYNSD